MVAHIRLAVGGATPEIRRESSDFLQGEQELSAPNQVPSV